MSGSAPLDILPLWGLFGLTIAVILLSLEGGYRLGLYRRRCTEKEKEAPVGAMVGATLGLLAFMLGFTFSMAASRFEGRRQVLLDESNAVGTAYLRAGFLPSPDREEVRTLLREYVDVRLEAAETGNIIEATTKSESLHSKLWTHAETVGRKESGSITVGLFIQALNQVIDLHSTRLQIAVRSRIPSIIWAVLYIIATLGMGGMGYQAGLSGTSRSTAVVVLVLAFSVVMLLISDLDRPHEGLLRVSQQPMMDLRKGMTPAQP